RYKHLHGKRAIIPFVDRSVPIIQDTYIDMEFGTGCLKVTPAHDANDYELGAKHDLEVIDILNEDGTMSEAAVRYIGEDRFDVRKKIVKDLENEDYLVKVEDYENKVGYSERTDVVIEPRLSLQWFLNMEELVKPALDNVMNDNVQFFPAKFKNNYNHWMENIKNWCISRQLWWGQQIPAYYYGKGDDDFVVAETAEQALEMAREKSGNNDLQSTDLKQDEDVLDTWFSSWLWPMEVFGGISEAGSSIKPNNKELNYYYPTTVLVTAHDIIFFWVARMIIAGYEYMDNKPFEHVYYTGMVRDDQRRKMSKQLGNSPDPLDLIDQYGADGVRFGVLISSPAGNDLLFEDKLCEQGRNFCNKLWNVLRLVKSWEVEDKETENQNVIDWFNSRINETQVKVEESFKTYHISEALMSMYTLIWDDFCSWYLEMVKPEFGQPIDKISYDATINYFEKLVQLLHPFMPFITEELWHALKDREDDGDIIVSQIVAAGSSDKKLLEQGEAAKDVIKNIRDLRNKANINQKEKLSAYVLSDDPSKYDTFRTAIVKTAFLEKFENTEEEVKGASTFVYRSDKFFIDTGQEIDPTVQKEKLLEELKYSKGFLKSVEAKLNNERFVNNAPAEVIDKEKQKRDDTAARIKALEESLEQLN
ncbi:MAG: valine--tRNA ligase, partial [Bacteroidetes bacterium]|nr:valine--tRNA ligase [Bacteroidota bacterium]